MNGKVLFALVALLFCVATVSSQPQPRWPPSWPPQLTMTQYGYWPSQGDAQTVSMWYYDYTNLRHRFDHQTLVNTPHDLLANQSSEIWIGYDLYMYNWDKNTCIHQDLGIGIPTPDWFKGNTSSLGELQYLQHNNTYYDTVQTITPGPYYKEYGPYQYYAYNRGGDPFRMAGPGTALGVVVNDWYDLIVGAPNPSLFDLPSTPECVTVGPEYEDGHYWTSKMFSAILKHRNQN